MIFFASIVFVVTLVLIVTLFLVKLREAKTGKVFLRPWREALDTEALHVKELLNAAQLDLKKIPTLLMYWGHIIIHISALAFARAARAAS